MTQITSYLDLRIAAAEPFPDRSLTDVMPRLVQFAERYLNSALRDDNMITSATVTMANGVGTLPTDFLEMQSVYVGKCRLKQMSSALVRELTSHRGHYATQGGSLLIGGASGDQVINYFAKLPTLTSGPTASNWLLEKAPDLYLYAVIVEAAKHLRDVEKVAEYSALREDERTTIISDNYRAGYGDAGVTFSGARP